MFSLILMMLRSLFSLRTEAAMKAEIIALRHQVIVLQRTQKTTRLMLNPADRWLWVCLSRIWSGWRSALIIVKPETVVSWHRMLVPVRKGANRAGMPEPAPRARTR